MADILIVEDELSINELIRRNLGLAGHRCTQAFDGEEAIELLGEKTFDLVILDIMLPGADGYEVFDQTHGIPVIFLTAKSELSDKLKGLTKGADDYITKPFNPLELTARVKTQLRRYTRYNIATQHTKAEQPALSDEISIRGLRISKNSHKCFLNETELILTPIEFSILFYLCEHKGSVISSEELFISVWGEACYDSNNTVMTHIARLREKMKEPARKPKYIKTVWGVGYTIES